MAIQSIDTSSVLANIPVGLRTPLLQEFNEIVKNYREQRWEPTELKGGKFSEVVYTILKGYIDNSYPSAPAKPPNMVDYCRKLEQADPLFSRSVRVHIPRVLIALYEVRSNRGVGHTGGDVNPNHMDSAYVLSVSKWVMAELVRVFHNVSTIEATQAVDAITERTLPLIWEIGDNKRVLIPNMELKDKCLALLFVSPHPVLEADLVRWVEPASPANFRRDFSTKYHKEKLIEFDKTTRMITLSPLGAKYVEQNIPLEL